MSTQMDAVRARWAALAPREKAMVAGAGAIIVLALVWMIFIGPALATLHSADAQRRALDTQLSRMVALQSQAQAMQSQPKIGRDETLRQLELSVRQRLGTAGRMTIAGDRVTVALTGAPADTLAQWLAQARAAAHALPAEAHINRNASGTWEGNIVLTLPRT
jgi:general secretion pathway protein M